MVLKGGEEYKTKSFFGFERILRRVGGTCDRKPLTLF
jgi:hypothetical protein